MIKKIISYSFLTIFFIYWASTIFFVLPSNPIRANSKRFTFDFSLLFDQRWSFFAPPPKSNTRLYYSFFNEKKERIGTFEVIKPILTLKQKKAPFNTEEEIVDYILNGAINHLYGLIQSKREEIQLTNLDSTLVSIEKMARDSILSEIENISVFKTLVNYSNYVAKKNLLKNELTDVEHIKIRITEKPIPRFIHRNEEMLFENLIIQTQYIPYEFEK